MSDSVEFYPSEDLGKSRRNFLFANSLLFLLAAVNPERVSIPGFAGITFNGVGAIMAVAVATLLFLYEFSLEYRLSRVRNGAFFANRYPDGSSGRTVDLAINKLANGFESLVTSCNTSLNFLESQVKSASERDVSRTFSASLSSATEHITNALSNRGDVDYLSEEFETIVKNTLQPTVINLAQLQARWASEGAPNFDGFKSSLDSLEGYVARIQVDIRRLDESVHGFQRSAFIWRDLVLIGCFAGCAMFLAMYRFYHAFPEIIEQVDFIAVGFGSAGMVAGYFAIHKERLLHRPTS